MSSHESSWKVGLQSKGLGSTFPNTYLPSDRDLYWSPLQTINRKRVIVEGTNKESYWQWRIQIPQRWLGYVSYLTFSRSHNRLYKYCFIFTIFFIIFYYFIINLLVCITIGNNCRAIHVCLFVIKINYNFWICIVGR